MLFTTRTIAAALAAVLLAAPAFAQTPKTAPPAAPPQSSTGKVITNFDDLTEEQQDEIYCIYDAVGADKDAAVLEDWIVFGEKDAEAKTNAVFERAQTACTAKHKWSKDQSGFAFVIAKAGVVADLSEQELRIEGFDDNKFKAVMGIATKMTPADFDALLDIAYGKKPDEAFVTKTKGLLYAAGVSKEGDVADIAIGFLASSLQEHDAIAAWIENKLY